MFNKYNDIILDNTNIPDSLDEFKYMLKNIEKSKKHNTDYIIAWIDNDKSHFLGFLYENGFENFSCNKNSICVVKWIGSGKKYDLPGYGTHIVRVEIILKHGNNVLLIKERIDDKKNNAWKLPSGNTDRTELLHQTCERELSEELGVSKSNLKFITCIGFGHRTTGIEGKNEVYFVCLVTLKTDLKFPTFNLDKSEVSDYKWTDISNIQNTIEGLPKFNILHKKCLDALSKGKALCKRNTSNSVVFFAPVNNLN